MRQLTGVCLASGLILAVAQLAGAAATSSSTAVIDWVWTDFDSSDAGAHVTWTSWSSYSYAGADNQYGASDYAEQELSGQVDTSALAAVPNASGSAWTTSSEIGETVDADTFGEGLFWASSWADAMRWGIFNITGSGILTVKIGYSLEQTLTTDIVGDSADGFSQVSVTLRNWDTGINYYDAAEIAGGPVVDGADYFNSGNAIITVQGWFFNGDTGGLLLEAYNDAAVESVTPEPAMLSLLAIGGFAMLRRRRKYVPPGQDVGPVYVFSDPRSFF